MLTVKRTPRSTATQDAILEAAVEEFIAHGFAGVRIEHVAKRAGYNKALVYRWFKDRETLFRAALERRFSRRAKLLEQLPDTLSGILQHWSRQTAADRNFMRMILREALEAQGKKPAQAEFRRKYYRRQVDLLRTFQADGRLGRDFDPEMLFVALLAVVSLTSALPQIVELATGLRPGSKQFEKRWSVFLSTLASHLSAVSPSKRPPLKPGRH